MQETGCLENSAEWENGRKLKRKEFWAAFGEVAPPKEKKDKPKKFWKRFKKKLPDQCAKMFVRSLTVFAVFSVLSFAGLNPVRFLVSKFL